MKDTPPKLKYNIKSELSKFSATQQADIREKIIARCKISRQTLSSYENVMEYEGLMIPADYLIIIADILNVRVVSLLTQPYPHLSTK